MVLIVCLSSCSQNKQNEVSQKNISDNDELTQMYQNDQDDRKSDNIEWNVVSQNDSMREVRTYELLDSEKVQTSQDYYHAAMIFQHGKDTVASGMAISLMEKSIELDSTVDKWLLAAAIDRDLMRRGQPQIYGTQYIIRGAEKVWELYKIDTTKINDAQRIEYGVKTISEQRENVINMNKKN